MLELKTNLKQVIEPLIYEALKAPLNVFAEKNYREADRNGLTTVTFRRKVAGLRCRILRRTKGQRKVERNHRPRLCKTDGDRVSTSKNTLLRLRKNEQHPH